jgi:hypothetical protein
MGLRGIVRAIVGILLGFQIISGALSGSFTIDSVVVIEAIILLVFGVWFILERIGILPKM